MTALRIWCFLLPLLVGFGVPALLTWRRRFAPAALYLAALLAIALVLSLFADPPAWALLKVTLFTLAFAVFVAGLHLVWPWPVVGQIASGAVVCAMMGSIFYFPKDVEGLPLPAIQQRIELALALNPYALLAAILDADVLRGVLYSDWADYPIVYPRWQSAAALYIVAGLALAGLGRLIAPRASPGAEAVRPS